MRVATVLGLLLLAFSSRAAAPDRPREKAAWEWSIDERLAARTDTVLAAQRVRAAQGSGGIGRNVSSNGIPSSAEVLDVIDGKTTPALFLPTEVFERFLTLAFVVDDNWQSSWQRDVREAGLPSDFWTRLPVVADPYLKELRWRYQMLQHGKRYPDQRTNVDAQIVGLSPAICRDAVSALARTRAAFGTSFDRFMYSAVAKGMSKVVFGTAEDRDRLSREARGCQ